MAQALYDYWFVQFDFPDENGRPYKSSGGKMVWDEQLKREIPEGWEISSIYSLAEYVNGIGCQKYALTDDDVEYYYVVKIKEMHCGINECTEKVKHTVPSTSIIENGDILFSWSASLEVILWGGGRAALNQHIFRVMPYEESDHWWLFQLLRSYVGRFEEIANSRKTTMGHITIEHLKQAKVCIPPKYLREAYHLKTDPLYSRILTIKQDNACLNAQRDFLLPLLMNGQVQVRPQGELNYDLHLLTIARFLGNDKILGP